MPSGGGHIISWYDSTNFTPTLRVSVASTWRLYGTSAHLCLSNSGLEAIMLSDILFIGGGLLVFAIAGLAVVAADRL